MAQKFKLIGYELLNSVQLIIKLEHLIGSIFTESAPLSSTIVDKNGDGWPKEFLILEPINTIAQLQEQRGDLSAQISEMDYRWYEQLVIDDVMNLNDPKQFVMDLCEKLNIELEIIDERNDEER